MDMFSTLWSLIAVLHVKTMYVKKKKSYQSLWYKLENNEYVKMNYIISK